jgi:hypothetical protein
LSNFCLLRSLNVENGESRWWPWIVEVRIGRGPRHPPLSLSNKCLPIISEFVPTIDLPDDELAAVTAAIRRAVEDDKFSHAPRLDRCGRR